MQTSAQAILGALETQMADHEGIDRPPNRVLQRVVLTARDRVDSAVHA
jgi:hypothetical protein